MTPPTPPTQPPPAGEDTNKFTWSEADVQVLPAKAVSQCQTCINFIEPYRCFAYKEGIPEDILDGRIDHSIARHGDNGIKYEKDPDLSGEGASVNYHLPLALQPDGKA